MGKRVQEPTGFLVADLKRVNAGQTMSPRMTLAGLMADLRALQEQENDPGPPLKEMLTTFGLIEDGADVPPGWKVQENQVERFTSVVQAALRRFESRRLRSSASATPFVTEAADNQTDSNPKEEAQNDSIWS